MSTEPRFGQTEQQRDVRAALAAQPALRVVTVGQYTADASATARIPISCPTRPAAVLLIDARPFFDQGGPLPVSLNLSFVWDAGSKTAQVYQPGGLTANTVYRLTYLVIGG